MILVIGISSTITFAQNDSDDNENNPCFQNKEEKLTIIGEAETETHHFGKIYFSGNLTTRDIKLRKRLAFFEGDIFTRKRLETNINNLSKSKYISPLNLKNVKVEIRTADKRVDVVFCVKEKGDNNQSENPCFQNNEEKMELIEKAENEEFNIKYIDIVGNTYSRYNTFLKKFGLNKNYPFNEGDIFRKASLFKAIQGFNKVNTIYP